MVICSIERLFTARTCHSKQFCTWLSPPVVIRVVRDHDRVSGEQATRTSKNAERGPTSVFFSPTVRWQHGCTARGVLLVCPWRKPS
jgi:hypothetical protein